MMFPWPPPDPQSVLNKLQDEMRGVVDRVWHTGVSTRPFDGQEWAPLVDLYEHPDFYQVFMEVPGVNPNEIDVSYIGNTVTVRGRKDAVAEKTEHVFPIRAERRFGIFCRTVELPSGVDVAKTSARCEAGVLQLKIPKSESSKPRTVKIQVNNA